MKQIKVNPRLIGYSGDWCWSLMPEGEETPQHVVPREFGDLLDVEPYTAVVIASFDAFDEGKWFTLRDGKLVCEPHTPNGYPEMLDRVDGNDVGREE